MKRIGRRITKSHNGWNDSQLQSDETTANLDIYSRMKPDHSICYLARHNHTRFTSSCHHCCSPCIATRHSSLVGNAARSTHWYGSGIGCARLLFRLQIQQLPLGSFHPYEVYLLSSLLLCLQYCPSFFACWQRSKEHPLVWERN